MAEEESKYIRIKTPELTQAERVKILKRAEINCNETTDKLVDSGYRVIYPTMSGVSPGYGTTVPASGGAVIKFYPDSEYHGSLYSEFVKNESIKSDSDILSSKIEQNINIDIKNSLSEDFGSIFLKARLDLQNILTSSSYIPTESEYPEFLISSLRSVEGVYKEKDKLENFEDLEKILKEKKEESKFNPLGKFKFISIDSILTILEKFIPPSYIEITLPDSENKEYYSIVKSNSGISFFSLYLSLKIHLAGNSDEIEIKQEFKKYLSEYNDSLEEYMRNSDLKSYSVLNPNKFEWDQERDNISLDFVIQEIFSFFIPYFKVYEGTETNYVGFYTLIDDLNSKITTGYAKTPDLSFENPDGTMDRSLIDYGLKFDSEKNTYSDESYDDKTFLIFDFNFGYGGFGDRSLIPIKYLPVPKVEVTENLSDDESYADAKIDLAKNIVIGIDLKDIIGGEFEAYGLNRAPNLSDYIGRICLNLNSSAVDSYSLYDGLFKKSFFKNDVEQFSFPNILGGSALTDSNIQDPQELLSDKNFPSGNFNIAMMEELSKMSSSVTSTNSDGIWLTNLKENIKNWHNSNVEMLSSELYMRGSNSGFVNGSIPSAKGLSSDMNDSFSSYRSYFLLNGIPNTNYMVKSLGFKSTKDYFNFNGRLDELLLIHNSDIGNNSKAENQLETILGTESGKSTFLTNPSGVLYCRPRIIDNNSNILKGQLSLFEFEKVDISTESNLSKSPDKVFIRIDSSNLNLDNLNLKNQDLFLSFYIIDKLGQYRKASRKIRIQRTDDLSSIQIDKSFYSQQITADSLISIPVSNESSGEISISSDIALNASLDENFSASIGSIPANIIRLSEEGSVISSNQTWSQAFGLPSNFSGTLFVSAENSTSSSGTLKAAINIEFNPGEIDLDEFSLVGSSISKIPLVNSGDVPKIEIKSKGKLFKSGGDLRFYYALPTDQNIISAEDNIALMTMVNITNSENILPVEDSSGDQYFVSSTVYASLSEAEPSPPFFGFGSGKKTKIPFPSKSFSNRDISSLKDFNNISIICCYGDINEIRDSSGKLLESKYSIINLNPKEGKPLFVLPPKIIEMGIISKNASKYTTNLNILKDNIDKRIMKGFSFEENKFSSNVDIKAKFDLIVALEGGPYKKRDIKFFIKNDESSREKKISGRILSPYYDSTKNSTIFRINSIKGEKDKGSFQIKAYFESKKYGASISSENILIAKKVIKNEDLLIDEQTREIILKQEEIFNLSDDLFKKYSEKSVGVEGAPTFTELVFPNTEKYMIKSEYAIGAVSEINKKDKVVTISKNGVEAPIESIEFPQPSFGSFPPSLPDIAEVLKPDVSFEASAEGISFSIGITNPIDPFIKTNPLGTLAKIPSMIGLGDPVYSKEEYTSKLKSIFLIKDSRISNDFYETSDTQTVVYSPIIISGESRVTFGMAKFLGAESDGEFYEPEEFGRIRLGRGVPSTIKFFFDGIPHSGLGFQIGGAEQKFSLSSVGNMGVVTLPYNPESLSAIQSNLGMTNLVLPSMVPGPCDSLDIVESDSAIRDSKRPPRDFSEGLELPIPNMTSQELEEKFKNLDLMELAYGKLKIRKPVAATKETIRSICDLSFHMTAELRIAIRGLKNLLVIIKVIFCIIDVICALGNPVKLGKAIVRLFLCLFDLLLLLPQLAIPLSFLKLIIHIGELALCLIVKVLKIYTGLSEMSIALGEAIALKDYESMMRLEKALNKHLFSLDADLSVLDPILDILDMFLELLELFFRFPCTTAEGGELFQVCGASDNAVCNFIIGELVKNGGVINTEALIPMAQSYTNMNIESLTMDQSQNPTINCGNTPPDEAADMPRAPDCFGSDNVNDIFIEPRKMGNGTVAITDTNTFDEESINGSSLRTVLDSSYSGPQLEASYRLSFTRNGKQPPDLSNILEGQDARKCSFHFNYKGITSKFAYENLIHWIFPKKIIDPDQTSDSPIFPLKKQGATLKLHKLFSNGITLCNPHTGNEYDLIEEEPGVFTVAKYKLEYLDSDGSIKEDRDHKVPEIVLVDDDFNVYIIEKIYLETDEESDKYGIYKIDAIRADYPTFDSKKFIKEDEQYISDPKIYFADQNFSEIKKFFSSGDFGHDSFTIDDIKNPDSGTGEPADPNDPITANSLTRFKSLIHLNDLGGDTLYENFGIIPSGSAINSENISEDSDDTIAPEGAPNFDFKGGRIFQTVFQSLYDTGIDGNFPITYDSIKFSEARDAFEKLFEDEVLHEKYGSFPYTNYIHANQTFRDPTNSYLRAFTNSIGTASVYDFPNLYLFDIDSINEELVQQCERYSAEKAAMEDNDPEEIMTMINSAQGCINKVRTGNIQRRNQIRQKLSNGESLSDLDFIKDPTIPAKEIKEMADCLESIALNDLCKIVINDLSTEFLIMEKTPEESTNIYQSPSLGSENEFPFSDEEIDIREISSYVAATGADKFSRGIGDNGVFEVGDEINIRIILRGVDDELINSGSLDFSKSMSLNIISDSGGQAEVVTIDGAQFVKTEYIEEDGSINYAYDATVKSDSPSEIEVTANICQKEIKAWAPSSLLNSVSESAQNESCNESNILNTQNIFAFAQLSKAPRVLSITVNEKAVKDLPDFDSGAFGSKQQGSTFGEQE